MSPSPSPIPTASALAFTLGILLTLGFKDFYPDLERRFRSLSWGSAFRKSRHNGNNNNNNNDGNLDAVGEEGEGKGRETIVDGIEGCIGHTPLVRIRSLSEATGCEILGKAEVCRKSTRFHLILFRKVWKKWAGADG